MPSIHGLDRSGIGQSVVPDQGSINSVDIMRREETCQVMMGTLCPRAHQQPRGTCINAMHDSRPFGQPDWRQCAKLMKKTIDQSAVRMTPLLDERRALMAYRQSPGRHRRRRSSNPLLRASDRWLRVRGSELGYGRPRARGDEGRTTMPSRVILPLRIQAASRDRL